MRSEYTAVIK